MQHDMYTIIGDAIKGTAGVTDALIVDGGEHADLATTVAFSLAKQKKQAPVKIAQDLAADLAKNPALAGIRIEVKGPYINFIFGGEYVREALREAVRPGYGNLPKKPVRVVLEHTSANPNGPLHVGHIRIVRQNVQYGRVRPGSREIGAVHRHRDVRRPLRRHCAETLRQMKPARFSGVQQVCLPVGHEIIGGCLPQRASWAGHHGTPVFARPVERRYYTAVRTTHLVDLSVSGSGTVAEAAP